MALSVNQQNLLAQFQTQRLGASEGVKATEVANVNAQRVQHGGDEASVNPLRGRLENLTAALGKAQGEAAASGSVLERLQGTAEKVGALTNLFTAFAADPGAAATPSARLQVADALGQAHKAAQGTPFAAQIAKLATGAGDTPALSVESAADIATSLGSLQDLSAQVGRATEEVAPAVSEARGQLARLGVELENLSALSTPVNSAALASDLVSRSSVAIISQAPAAFLAQSQISAASAMHLLAE